MQSRTAFRAFALALVTIPFAAPGNSIQAQDFPLAPVPPTGLTVSPFFEGWYLNADGTYTLSFGYFNRNSQEAMYIPIGPENFIEPAEFNGMQPEHFPSRRVRGTFTVTVPASWGDGEQRVVWTLINRGQTLTVPGRIGVSAYALDLKMAMGSVPPVLRFTPDGPAGRGPTGIMSDEVLTTSVEEPLTLRLWAIDESERVDGQTVNVGMAWTTHQGPALASFSDRENPDAEAGGESTVTVTFSEPGEYVLRAQADVFSARDSSSGNQCCWTNGYVRVVVTP